MFSDLKNPTMNELIYWLQVKYPSLTTDMKSSNHSAVPDEPNPYHIEDSVWTHTMMVCLRAENDNSNKVVKICALLHDIGKPLSRGVIPFESKKPIHSESNEIRNNGKFDGKDSGLNRVIPKSGLKVHFRGHEGLSYHIAIGILNKLEKENVISEKEKISILNIISLHGTLFDNIKDGGEYKPQNVISKFKDYQMYRDLVQQVKNDSLGRFFTSKDGRKNSAHDLGDTFYNEETWNNNQSINSQVMKTNSIKMLVGLPNSGKSTWRGRNTNPDDVIISRDDIMMKYAQENIKDPKVNSYSEVWKYLEDNNLHQEVDKLELQIFQNAVRNRKNIIIDRTNMSRKSRRKWLHSLPSCYEKEAIIFATDLEEIETRNKRRSFTEGKNIPESVIHNMSKSFMVPTFDEFDKIEWEF